MDQYHLHLSDLGRDGDIRSGRAGPPVRGRLDERSVHVWVVIVNWNTRDALDSCLTSLERTVRQVEARAVVVDNGSTDGSVDMVRDVHPGVRVVANEENRGFAAAVNQGIKMGMAPPLSASTILLLNSDTQLQPRAVDRSVEAMLENPRLGALGCRLENEDGSIQASCHRFVTLPRLLFSKMPLPRSLAARLRLSPTCTRAQSETGDFDYLKGAFLLLRSEALREVGQLDERYFMYAEEADLCLRLRSARWELEYLSDVGVVHKGGGSTGGDRSARVASVNRLVSRLKFIEKHRGPTVFRIAVVLHLVANAFRWLGSILLRRRDARHRARRKIRACIDRQYEIPQK